MMQRYCRAAKLAAPRSAAGMPGIAAEGYWVDNDLYFFLAERFDSSLGRIVAVPSMADRRTCRVEEPMAPEALMALLSRHADRPVGPDVLSSARFDMPDRDTLAVSVLGRDWLVDVRRQRVVRIRASPGTPGLHSPDGRYVCFVKGDDIWLKEREGGTEQALTTDGAPHNYYGQYRLGGGSCPLGLWSPDSQWFLTHRIDERAVPETTLLQHAPPGGGRPVLHRYRFPMPGDALPVATYVAVHADSGRIVSFEGLQAQVLGRSPFSRFWRLTWFSGANTAWFLRLDRYFKKADLVRLDLEQGTGKAVLAETVTHGYFEFHPLYGATPNVRILANSGEVIWFSERDGWGHLYLYDAATGALKNRITRGDWLVRDIVHVDEEHRRVLFTACGIDPESDPARRVLCAVNLDGSGFEVLLAHDGDLVVPRTEPAGLAPERPFCPPDARPGVSPDGRFATVLHASLEHGNATRIVNLATWKSFAIASVAPSQAEVPPRLFTALAADGLTRIHGALFMPSDFDEHGCYPLIDYIYPGPSVTQQPQYYGSSNAAFARALAELGFVTLMLDTRGMPFRSRSLHQMGYGELLEPQLADHAAVVRQLCERHRFLDADRVGMIGYSGGGYATARALFDYGDTFKVGVSVCGNHDNSFVSATWSDKYRGPKDDERWAAQANGAVACKLTGKLLLVSGDMDDNVHVSQTLALVDALVRANRDFDLLVVPNENHALLLTNGYVLRRVWDYFVRHLLGEVPPDNFEIKFEPHEIQRMENIWMQAHAW